MVISNTSYYEQDHLAIVSNTHTHTQSLSKLQTMIDSLSTDHLVTVVLLCKYPHTGLNHSSSETEHKVKC